MRWFGVQPCERGLVYFCVVVALWINRTLISCCVDESALAGRAKDSVTAKTPASASEQSYTHGGDTGADEDKGGAHPPTSMPTPAQLVLTYRARYGDLSRANRRTLKRHALNMAFRPHATRHSTRNGVSVSADHSREPGPSRGAETRAERALSRDGYALGFEELIYGDQPIPDAYLEKVLSDAERKLEALRTKWFVSKPPQGNGETSSNNNSVSRRLTKLTRLFSRLWPFSPSARAHRARKRLKKARKNLKWNLETFLYAYE